MGGGAGGCVAHELSGLAPTLCGGQFPDDGDADGGPPDFERSG